MARKINFPVYYSKARRSGYDVSLDVFLDAGMCPEAYDPFAEPERDYRHYLLRRALPRVIRDELTPDQRELIYLRYWHRMKVVEIAAKKNLHKATVSRTLTRAEERIRRVLGYLFQDEFPQ